VNYSDVTNSESYHEILWCLESTETLEGEYGVERWDFNANPVGVEPHAIFAKLFVHQDYHLLLVHDDYNDQALYRINSCDHESSLNTAREIFSDHCETYAP
jgi:hypothetical protein